MVSPIITHSCFHDKVDGNPHVHIMLTMRSFNDNGTWGSKQKKVYFFDDDGKKIYDSKKRQYKCNKIQTTDWNEHSKAEDWRAAWADAVNGVFEQQGMEMRIDHRSFERQGIELIPTVHLGAAAMQMERKGIRTERGDKNREIAEINKKLRQIKARIGKMENWLNEERENTPPTLFEVFTELTNHAEGRSQKQRIRDLQLDAQTLIFIQKYNVETFADMKTAVANLKAQYNDKCKTLVAMSRRYHTLTEHVKQAENYQKCAKIYHRFNELKGDKQDAFFNKHKDEIRAFTEAHSYLTRHLNGRKDIPLFEWRKELDEITVNRDTMLLESEQLTVELKSAEAILRNAGTVMDEKTQDEKSSRKHGMDL